MPAPNEPLGKPTVTPRKTILELATEQIARTDAMLNLLAPGKRAAIVMGAQDGEYFVGAAARIGGSWVLSGELETDLKSKPTWDLSVRWSK